MIFKLKERSGSEFYRSMNHLVITSEEMQRLKTIKSTRKKSGYVDSVASWVDDIISHNRLATLIHFFAQKVEFTEKFKKKHNVKKYHINLIRRMYIDESDYGACMCFKRPYGNSNVLKDVRDEYERIMGSMIKFKDIPVSFYENLIDELGSVDKWSQNDKNEVISEYSYDNSNDGFLTDIHNQTMDILDKALEELELLSMEWISDTNTNGISNWNPDWQPTEKGIHQYLILKREKKLKNILNK